MIIKKFTQFINETELYNNINSIDIIECIKNKGIIKAKLLKNNSEYNSDEELTPYNYENGEVQVEYKGGIYYVNIDDVIYVQY